MFYQDSVSSSGSDGEGREHHRPDNNRDNGLPISTVIQPPASVGRSLPEAEQSVRAFGRTLENENALKDMVNDAARASSHSRTLHIDATSFPAQASNTSGIAQVRHFHTLASSSSSSSSSSEAPHSRTVKAFKKIDTTSTGSTSSHSSHDAGPKSGHHRYSGEGAAPTALPASGNQRVMMVRKLPMASSSSEDETTEERMGGKGAAQKPGTKAGQRPLFPPRDRNVTLGSSSEDEESDDVDSGSLTLDSPAESPRAEGAAPAVTQPPQRVRGPLGPPPPPPPPLDTSGVDDPAAPPVVNAPGSGLAHAEVLASLASTGASEISDDVSEDVQAAIEAKEHHSLMNSETRSPATQTVAAESTTVTTDTGHGANVSPQGSSAAVDALAEKETPVPSTTALADVDELSEAPPFMEHSVSVAPPPVDDGSQSGGLDTRTAALITSVDEISAAATALGRHPYSQESVSEATQRNLQQRPQPPSSVQDSHRLSDMSSQPVVKPARVYGSMRPPTEDGEVHDDTVTHGTDASAHDIVASSASDLEVEAAAGREAGFDAAQEEEEDEDVEGTDEEDSREDSHEADEDALLNTREAPSEDSTARGPDSEESHEQRLPPGCPAAEDTGDDDMSASGSTSAANDLRHTPDDEDKDVEAEAAVPPLNIVAPVTRTHHHEQPQQPYSPPTDSDRAVSGSSAPQESPSRDGSPSFSVAQGISPRTNEVQASQASSVMLRQPLSCSSPREYPGHTRSVDPGYSATRREAARARAHARALFPLDPAEAWTRFLASLPLTDASGTTAMYHASEASPDDADERDELLVKVLSLVCQPPVNDHTAMLAADAAAMGTAPSSPGAGAVDPAKHAGGVDALTLDDDDAEGSAAADPGQNNTVTTSGLRLRALSMWSGEGRRHERAALQAAAQRLALNMYETQERMAEVGLMGRPFPDIHYSSASASTAADAMATERRQQRRQRWSASGHVVCRGITALRVDADCRLLAELDIEPCCISLSDFMAFQAFPLAANEVVAVLKSCTAKVAALHSCGFVHGALHGGNVLLSTDDGHCTLTQPAGVMSSFAFPSDLSVLSPTRARALLSIVDKIWPSDAMREASGSTGVGLSTSGHRQRLGQRPTPLDPEEKVAWFMLETVGGDEADGDVDSDGTAPVAPHHSPTMQDDLYAIANLAVLLLLGVPVFHGARLPEVVRTLTSLFPEKDADIVSHRASLCETFVLAALRSTFAALRYHQAGYSRSFVQEMETFICDCLISGCLTEKDEVMTQGSAQEGGNGFRRYRSAMDLLEHPLLQSLSGGAPTTAADGTSTVIGSTMMTEEGEEGMIHDTVHRLVYPVYMSMETTKAACGSKPYLVRLHRNSIFAARQDALRSALMREQEYRRQQRGIHDTTKASAVASADSALPPAVGTQDMLVADVVAGLWPYLEGQSHRWTVPFPSVTNCCGTPFHGVTAPGVDSVADALMAPAEAPVRIAEAYFPSCAPSLSFQPPEADRTSGRSMFSADADPAVKAAIERVETVKECEVLPNVHTLLFQGKERAALKLTRTDVQPLRGTVDTLILKDLDHCSIEVTTHMRFVALMNVRHCEILLGPCFASYMRDVYDCPAVAVAGSHLMLDRVERVGLYYSGPSPPTAFAVAEDDTDDNKEGGSGPQQQRRRHSRSLHSLGSDRADTDDAAVTGVQDVQMQAYALAYPGLSEDFAAVGLAQEHLTTIHASFDDDDDDEDDTLGTGDGENELTKPEKEKATVEKQFLYLASDGTGHDYPYSHALAAFGHRFVHRDDSESDVYFFYNELRDKDVHILDIHGGPDEGRAPVTASSSVGAATETVSALSVYAEETEHGASPSLVKSSSHPSRSSLYRDMQRRRQRGSSRDNTGHPRASSTSPNEVTLIDADRLLRGARDEERESEADVAPEQPRYPLIFILDVVEDVVIRNCSECTVFVLGSKSSIVMEDCRDMRVFGLARESVVERCVGVDYFAFVTEYMGVVSCQQVTISPLFVQCGYFDTILESVLLETTEEEKDAVYAAYEERDVTALNIVLQGVLPEDGSSIVGNRMVGVTSCVDTVIKDAQWYADHVPVEGMAEEDMDLPFIVHVRVPVPEQHSQYTSGAGSPLCNFFFECIEADGRDIRGEFQHVNLGDVTYNHEDHQAVVGLGLPEHPESSFTAGAIPLQRIHDLINPSLLRLPRSFALRANPSGASRRQSSASLSVTQPEECAPDLILERISLGEVHLVECVGNLFVRNCSGPLDITVCAAQNVIMEGCENVIVRTSCFTFAAQDCHHCHVALHVNTRPRYLRCSDMLTSALNITTVGMEALMAGAGVQQEVNLFNRPIIVAPDTPTVVAGGEAALGSGRRAHDARALAACRHAVFREYDGNSSSAAGHPSHHHAYPSPRPSQQLSQADDDGSPHLFCTECVCESTHGAGANGGLRASFSLSTSTSIMALAHADHGSAPGPTSAPQDGNASACVDSLAEAFARLRCPITVVAPLPGVVVGAEYAALPERMSARVAKEETRAPVEDGLMSALAFLCESDLRRLNKSDAAQNYLGTPATEDRNPGGDGVALEAKASSTPPTANQATHARSNTAAGEAFPTYPTTLSADGEARPASLGLTSARRTGAPFSPTADGNDDFSPEAPLDHDFGEEKEDEEDEEGDGEHNLQLHTNHLRSQQRQQPPTPVNHDRYPDSEEDIPEVVVGADNRVTIRQSPHKGTAQAEREERQDSGTSSSVDSDTDVVYIHRRPGVTPPPPPPPLQTPRFDDDSSDGSSGPSVVQRTPPRKDVAAPKPAPAISPLTSGEPRAAPAGDRNGAALQGEAQLRPPTPSPGKTFADAATSLSTDSAATGNDTPQRTAAGEGPNLNDSAGTSKAAPVATGSAQEDTTRYHPVVGRDDHDADDSHDGSSVRSPTDMMFVVPLRSDAMVSEHVVDRYGDLGDDDDDDDASSVDENAEDDKEGQSTDHYSGVVADVTDTQATHAPGVPLHDNDNGGSSSGDEKERPELAQNRNASPSIPAETATSPKVTPETQHAHRPEDRTPGSQPQILDITSPLPAQLTGVYSPPTDDVGPPTARTPQLDATDTAPRRIPQPKPKPVPKFGGAYRDPVPAAAGGVAPAARGPVFPHSPSAVTAGASDTPDGKNMTYSLPSSLPPTTPSEVPMGPRQTPLHPASPHQHLTSETPLSVVAQRQFHTSPATTMTPAEPSAATSSLRSPLSFVRAPDAMRSGSGVSDTELRRARQPHVDPTTTVDISDLSPPTATTQNASGASHAGAMDADAAHMVAAPQETSLHVSSADAPIPASPPSVQHDMSQGTPLPSHTSSAGGEPKEAENVLTPAARRALQSALAEARARHAEEKARMPDDDLARRVALAVEKVGGW